MTIHFLQNIFEKSINGEWGNEDSGKGEATAVIRTSNFLNSGRLNLDNIVCRDIDKNKNSDKILRTGDIIIEKSGGSPNQPVGRVVYFDVTDQDYFTNNFTSILRVKPGYNSKYIFYLMKYLYDTKKVLKFQNQTTGIINLKLTDYLNKTKVNIETIENQNTIVDILDRLEYQIINRNKQLSELSNLVKSRFNEMFGDIFDTTFPIYRLEELCEFIKDGTHQTPQYTDDRTNGFKFLSSKDVTSGKISWGNIKYITESLHNELYAKISPRRNDILLAKNGTTGIAALVDCDEIFDIYVSLAILRFYDGNNPTYLLYAINSDATKWQFESNLKGVGVPNLHLREIRKTKIPLPPLSLQNEFADFVAQVDKSQLAIQKSLEELETLKKSLMQEYFG